MSGIRRVVTGHDAAGRAVFASDTTVPGVEIPGMPGTTITDLWGADSTLAFPDAGDKPAYADFFPPVGGFRFLVFTVPPEGAAGAGDAAAMAAAVPSLAATMKADAPGMHRSATVDLLCVLSGRCVLELDDGSTRELAAGDTVVQSGTMHAWRNPFAEPCRILAAIVGARLG